MLCLYRLYFLQLFRILSTVSVDEGWEGSILSQSFCSSTSTRSARMQWQMLTTSLLWTWPWSAMLEEAVGFGVAWALRLQKFVILSACFNVQRFETWSLGKLLCWNLLWSKDMQLWSKTEAHTWFQIPPMLIATQLPCKHPCAMIELTSLAESTRKEFAHSSSFAAFPDWPAGRSDASGLCWGRWYHRAHAISLDQPGQECLVMGSSGSRHWEGWIECRSTANG